MSSHITGELNLCFFAFGIMEQGGGFENYVIETALGLKTYYPSISITILTASPELTERLQDILSFYHFKKHDRKNVYREKLEHIEKRINGKVNYIHFEKLNQISRMLRIYDVIYSKNEILELLLLKFVGYRNIPPLVIGVHTPIYYPNTPSLSARLHNILYTGPIYRWLLSGAQSVKVNTQDDESFIRRKALFGNVQVVHHAFTVPKLAAASCHVGFRLLFVGRLTEQKGVDILIELIRLLKKNNAFEGMTLKIAGSGDNTITQDIEALAQSDERVEYLGHIQNSEIYKLYEWCDATVVPSRYETLNKVAIETAMAAKVTVVSDIPGPREFIIHGKTGYLVQPSAQAFFSQIVRLYDMKENNPEEFREIGVRARQKIVADFNPELIYHQLFRELRIAKKLKLV